MPWKECHVMDERLRFVARLLEGEKMAPLCAAFGISRKTGYKIFERYKDCGLGAFTDRRRRPFRQPNRLPAPLEATIVRLKREDPGWGAPKVREKLRQQVLDVQLPAISTVHAVLDRHGLVRRRRRRRPTASSSAQSRPTEPNALWSADFKVSSCSAIGGTATRSRSPTSPAATFDDEAARVQPIDYPFGSKVLPMSPE
jgi:transposase